MTVMEERTRCIVLRPETDADTQRLDAALASREWSRIDWNGPYEAMVELCLCQRAEASRAAWGLENREQLALTVADVVAGAELVDAVRRYLPSVQIWRLEGEELSLEHEGVRPATKIDEPSGQTPAVEPWVPAAHAAPLKLAESSLDDPFPTGSDASDEPSNGLNNVDDDDADARPDGPSTEVTQEELAMLLAFDPPSGEVTP